MLINEYINTCGTLSHEDVWDITYATSKKPQNSYVLHENKEEEK
jgi:hypothetical protein